MNLLTITFASTIFLCSAVFSSPCVGDTVLDFSNSTSTLDDNGVGSIIFSEVTPDVDLVVTADSNYQAFNASNNGTVNSDDYQIHIGPNIPVTRFTWSFVDAATQTIPQVLTDFNISVLDLDVGGEKIELYTPATYTVRDDHNLSLIDDSNVDRIIFGGKTGGEVNNPTNSSNLSNAQQRVAVNLHFDSASTVELGFSTLGTSGGRNFSGDSHLDSEMFDQATTTYTFSTVPEPSGSVFLVLLSGLIARRSRRSVPI